MSEPPVPNPLRIGIVVGDVLDFGGLEEIATETAVALRRSGHQVCLLSLGSAAPGNQYLVQLRRQGVPFFQSPRWLYRAATDWATKERLLAVVVVACWPAVALAALALMVARRQTGPAAFASARGRLARLLMDRLIGPNRRQSLGRLLLAVWRWRWRPDLMHLQGYTSSLLFVVDWAASHRVPVVYTENQTPDARFDWWKDFGPTINKAVIVVAASETSAEALRTICGIQRPIVTFTPPVADPVAEGHSVALRAVAPGEPLNVCTMARLVVTKGLEYWLAAVAAVRPLFPTARFRVYGEGPLRAELLAWAAQLGLNGEEIFVGMFTRAKLPAIMAQTDVFVMSSVLEGLPLALIEAMAYGRPIVATAVGGIAEVIRDGENGLLCPPRDAACLSRKLSALLSDSALRARLAAAARQAYAQGRFAPPAVAQHHLNVYRQALAMEQPAPGGIHPDAG